MSDLELCGLSISGVKSLGDFRAAGALMVCCFRAPGFPVCCHGVGFSAHAGSAHGG